MRSKIQTAFGPAILLVILIFVEQVFATRGSEPNRPLADYSKFSHATPKEHADLMDRTNCASCHRRSDGSVEPRFPAPKACTCCHPVHFTASHNSPSVTPICTVCH